MLPRQVIGEQPPGLEETEWAHGTNKGLGAGKKLNEQGVQLIDGVRVLLCSMGLPTHLSSTHPIHLEKGYRSALRNRRQHVDGDWDGDCGLLVLQQDHG